MLNGPKKNSMEDFQDPDPRQGATNKNRESRNEHFQGESHDVAR